MIKTICVCNSSDIMVLYSETVLTVTQWADQHQTNRPEFINWIQLVWNPEHLGQNKTTFKMKTLKLREFWSSRTPWVHAVGAVGAVNILNLSDNLTLTCSNVHLSLSSLSNPLPWFPASRSHIRSVLVRRIDPVPTVSCGSSGASSVCVCVCVCPRGPAPRCQAAAAACCCRCWRKRRVTCQSWCWGRWGGGACERGRGQELTNIINTQHMKSYYYHTVL